MFLVHERDVPALADVLESLLTDAVLRRRLGEGGRFGQQRSTSTSMHVL